MDISYFKQSKRQIKKRENPLYNVIDNYTNLYFYNLYSKCLVTQKFNSNKTPHGFFVGAFEKCYRKSQYNSELPEIKGSDDIFCITKKSCINVAYTKKKYIFGSPVTLK